MILARDAADQSAMTRNQRNACLSVAIASLGAAAPAVAGPITSVSINGSITFTDVMELNNPEPAGPAGIRTHDAWNPRDFTLFEPGPLVAQVARFRSDDGPSNPDGHAPRVGDAWGLAMLASLELLEDGTVSGQAGHRLDLSFRDMTLGASAYVLRGIVDLSITGHVQAPDPATQMALTNIQAEAFAKTDTSLVRLIDFGGVQLSSTGDRVVNRSLWSTFEVVLNGTPGSSTSIDMWIDIGFTTSLTSVPSPSGAMCLFGLGGLVACSRRRAAAR